jgi:hypothetical protein
VTGGVERVLRWVYTLGLGVASILLLGGLVLDEPRLLEAGVLAVMTTPLCGAVLLAAAMAVERDWRFTAVALLVLGILGSSLYAAARLSRPRAPAEAIGAPRGEAGVIPAEGPR